MENVEGATARYSKKNEVKGWSSKAQISELATSAVLKREHNEYTVEYGNPDVLNPESAKIWMDKDPDLKHLCLKSQQRNVQNLDRLSYTVNFRKLD